LNEPIGVFDSGVGGLSILKALRAELPAEDFIYFADSAHGPYGERDEDYVVERTRAVTRELVERHAVKALVIACNTATAAAIHVVRAEHAALTIVGVEPALKPAVIASRTGHIAVLATRRTLASAKFQALHDTLKNQARFALQSCDGLADAIERDDTSRIAGLCNTYLSALGPWGTDAGELDTLVLGCTHYPLAQSAFAAWLPHGVQMVEPGAPVARQLGRLLATRGQARTGTTGGQLQLLASGCASSLRGMADRCLGHRTGDLQQ
jgi:glutamate racemase